MKKKTLYDDLEIPRDANKEAVKKAFRKKAKKTHPDAGGNAEEFRVAVRAYNILSDEEKRKRYDDGENPEDLEQGDSYEQQVLGAVFAIFNSVIEQGNIDLVHNDLFEIIRKAIKENQQRIRAEINKIKSKIERYKNTLKRIKRKDKSIPFIRFLETKIEECNAIITQLEAKTRLGDDALKLIEGCEYEVQEQYEVFEFYISGTTTAT